MLKFYIKSFCVLLMITMCMGACSDWNACPKFVKKKPRNRWCYCDDNNHDDDNITTEKPPKPTTPSFDHDDDPEDEMCKPYNPPTPDFSRPRQRISVTKCHEYIWQIKVRIERAERQKQCNYNKWKSHVFKRETNINISLETLFSVPVVPENVIIPTKYIMGGRDAFPKEFPHMGAVGWRSSDPERNWKFMCGSSLISPNFALTASHCISADPRDTSILDIKPKIIRFGAEDLITDAVDHSAEDRNISKIIPHPKYRSPLKYYDIALFELDRPLTFNKFFQPACLWTEDMSRVKRATVTGWGVTNPEAHEGHPYLQAADLEVIDWKLCDELLWQYHNRRWPQLMEYQFCAGQLTGGVDACQGDSGGPFQMKIPLPPQVARQEGNMHYVIGVTSFGISCGLQDVPGVYTQVSYFLDFIESVVWP